MYTVYITKHIEWENTVWEETGMIFNNELEANNVADEIYFKQNNSNDILNVKVIKIKDIN